ncbi:MAG TPA: YihY/virulence factor BrkB family protein [Chloroflexia bacterium]|nr:YihY/virulence factor BrkB family protein [Chloroflexia bacterium]
MIDRGEPKAEDSDPDQIDQNEADQKLSFPQTVFNVTRDTISGFIDDDCLVLAGAVSYSALQSVVPLVLGFIAVGSLFLQDSNTRQEFINGLIAAVPAELTSVIKFDELIKNFINGAGLAGVISVLALLWTGSGVFGQLKYAVNKAFKVEKDLRNPVIQTGIQLLMLVILGGLMVLAFGVNIIFGLIFNIKISLFGISPYDFSFILPVLSYLIPFALEAAVFLFLYKFSPARKGVRWKPVILAGIITALLFELLKLLFGVYLVVFNAAGSAAKTYGAIGGIFVFLFFLYLAALVILLGAELAARLHNFPYGLATARGKEALVETPAENIQNQMVPKRFAPIVKKAEKSGQLPPGAEESAKPGTASPSLASTSLKRETPAGKAREGEINPPEERLAMVTGSLVLVAAAIIGVLLRRKPPTSQHWS